MASKQLINTVNGYEKHIRRYGVNDQVINAYVMASGVAMSEDKDIQYGLECSKRVKELIDYFVKLKVGADIYALEKFAQDNKASYEILDNPINDKGEQKLCQK